MLEEIAIWQACPLEPVYPLVFFDALRVKVRDEGIVRNKASILRRTCAPMGPRRSWAFGWSRMRAASSGCASCHPTKPASWGPRLNELRNRGTEDILLAVVDGLKGFPDAIRAVFPEATVQT